MKRSIQISSLIVFSLLFAFPPAAMSDVKISLHNGRTIRADRCKDVGAKLICETLGGSFEIEKKDVLNLSERKAAPQYYRIDESADAEQQQVSGQTVKAPTKEEAKNRLNQITERKKELQSEREKLEQERKQLEQDMKNAPQQLRPLEFDKLNRRNIELEEKIRKFNAEVQTLDKEEKNLIENLAGSQ